MGFDMNYSLLTFLYGNTSIKTILVKKDKPFSVATRKKINKKTKIPSLPIIEDDILYKEDTKPVEIKEESNFTNKKLVCLTFDDGPSKYTDELLEILHTNKSKATFFITGNNIVANKDIIKRIDTYGNQIGNHGYTHIPFTSLDVDEVNVEIAMTSTMLIDLGVNSSNIVRPPFGKLSESLKEQIHAPFILYNIDPEDWKHQDKGYIKQVIKSRIEDGSIILLHDQYKETIEAIKELIPELKQEGYEFVTVNEMQKKYDISLEPGMVYAKLRKNVA